MSSISVALKTACWLMFAGTLADLS